MAAMLLGSLSVSAYDFSVGGIYYNIKNSSDFTVEVTYEKYEKNTYISPYSGDIEILLDLETEKTVKLKELIPNWWGCSRFEK